MSTKSIIESSFRKALYKFNLIEDNKIAIALSGGKDSLTLLHLLKAVSGRGFPKLDLHAFHVSGAFSCGPSITTNFLKKMCEELEIPLTVLESNQNDLSKLECYSCSRQRRTLLFKSAKEKGYKIMAFGHHLDDSIETLLMNLFQKGEFAANLPKVYMYDYEMTIIRPLILVKETLILNYSKEMNFFRMTCQCPVGQNSMRKKVKNLINEIEQIYPHLRTNLSHAGENYGSDKALKK
jgi:tRNA 2-thiocytidine biosynthesis protein TtcA